MIFDPDRPWRGNPKIPEWVKHLKLRQAQNLPPDNPDGLKKSWSIQYGLPWPYDQGTPEEHFRNQSPKRGYTLEQWKLARLPSAVVRDFLADVSTRPEFR